MTINPSLGQPLARTRLHEEIVSILQNQIMTGDIAPGTRITPERDLAESLKVNRATVREAMRKLENLGLVEIRHGDGVYAKNFLESDSLDLLKFAFNTMRSVDVIYNIAEVRRIVVPEMAFLCAQRRTDADLAELEKVAGDPGLSILEKDLALHRVIARSTGNLVYTIMLNFFNNLCADVIRLYFENEANVARSRAFHRDIVEAIRQGKAEEARRITQEVLLFVEDSTKDALAGQ